MLDTFLCIKRLKVTEILYTIIISHRLLRIYSEIFFALNYYQYMTISYTEGYKLLWTSEKRSIKLNSFLQIIPSDINNKYILHLEWYSHVSGLNKLHIYKNDTS